MNKTIAISALTGAVAALAVLAVVAIAEEGAVPFRDETSHQAMMGAMRSGDAAAMEDHMRFMMGDEAYERMLETMAEHRAGMMEGDTGGMMQQMMEAMMGGSMPMHDATPTPAP
jgi:hypothetical protein